MSRANVFEFADGEVALRDVNLPVHYYLNSDIPCGLIVGHGLGARNPKTKDYSSDPWLEVVVSGVQDMMSTVLYTARGHRGSSGWESSAEADPQQFTWARLSYDMRDIAEHFHFSEFIAAGNSMGSATALYACINFPAQVKAAVLVRPPTAWETRAARKNVLISSAQKCQAINDENDKHHFVLYGSALADFPSIDDTAVWNSIECPVLILSIVGDETHPTSTATQLASLLKHSKLHIAQTEHEAKDLWPAIISGFLRSIIE
jgi:3-oxoadipate enol-lactonase